MNKFFAENPVFTTDQVRAFFRRRGTTKDRAAGAWLAYHYKNGHIIRIKQGLYATVPEGANPESFTPDLFILASRMSRDAVLVYHTALEFHGRAYTTYNRLTYQTAGGSRPFEFHGWRFLPVSVAGVLQKKGKSNFGVRQVDRNGVKVSVASLERTLVDVLHRPVYCGGWEEIWRSLEAIEFFDLEEVVEYVVLLENATTAAKVGFFLDQHKERLLVDDKHLEILHSSKPKRPHYLLRGEKKGGKWIKEWNLIVPEEILNRSWTRIL